MKFFILFLILSCTQLPQQSEYVQQENITFDIFKKSVRGFCLNSEGRAQISVGRRSFTVSYDTQTPNPNKFILTAYIPLRGGEDLIIERENGRYRFSGGFVGMIKSRFYAHADANPGVEREDLSKFLSALGFEVFSAIDFKRKNDAELQSYFSKWCGSTLGLKCTYNENQRQMEVESQSYLVKKFANQSVFSWKNHDWAGSPNDFYRQSSFELINGDSRILSARLYAEQCQ